MRKCVFVTYPRSGHHILLGLLDSFVNVSGNHCEFYECKNNKNEPIDCSGSTISWKNKNGCCSAGRSVIKSHDFDLGLDCDDNVNYLVQLRNPILSITSWYELALKSNDANTDFETFFEEKFNFWVAFVDKWMSLKDRPNVIFVSYDSLGSFEVLDDISKFLGLPERQISNYDANRFKPKRAPLSDPNGIYSSYESRIKDVLTELNIPLLFSHPSNVDSTN